MLWAVIRGGYAQNDGKNIFFLILQFLGKGVALYIYAHFYYNDRCEFAVIKLLLRNTRCVIFWGYPLSERELIFENVSINVFIESYILRVFIWCK